MLDSKTDSQGKKYCDIILISDHLPKWQKAMNDIYESKGYICEYKSLGAKCHGGMMKTP
jgi:hypothetical protein